MGADEFIVAGVIREMAQAAHHHRRVVTVITMFLFGMAAFAVVAPLQLQVMTAAGHAPDVASAANISPSPWAVRWASTAAGRRSTADWASRRSTGSVACSPPAA